MQIEQWSTDKLIPYENNPRINDGAVEAVANSIREFGFRNPIIVDGGGTIITGHTRLKAAKQLKLDTVPVVVAADLSEEQARALRLADNKTGELSSWDFAMLEEELDAITGIDMKELFGFDVLDIVEDAALQDFFAESEQTRKDEKQDRGSITVRPRDDEERELCTGFLDANGIPYDVG